MGKDSKAMQQPVFQCLIEKMAWGNYGKTFVINSSKPLSLPPENSGSKNDTVNGSFGMIGSSPDSYGDG